MRIIIPMAGLGTRLRPLTLTRPKPLISVAGKAVLGHFLDSLDSLPEIEEAIFIVGYLGEQVEAYMQELYPDLRVRFVVQRELLGQSHAIWQARENLEGPAVIAFVDTLTDADLSPSVLEGQDAVAWVKEVQDPRRFGVVELAEDNDVIRVIEKPQDDRNNLAVVGFYYFRRIEDLIDAIGRQIDAQTQLKGEYYLADAINILLNGGLRLRAREVSMWLDCGTPSALLEANRRLLEQGLGHVPEAIDRSEVSIVPPVYIDPSANLRQSVIGPFVSIGPGCVIERSTLSESIVEDHSTVTDCELSSSLIGRHAHVTGQHVSLTLGDSSEAGFDGEDHPTG